MKIQQRYGVTIVGKSVGSPILEVYDFDMKKFRSTERWDMEGSRTGNIEEALEAFKSTRRILYAGGCTHFDGKAYLIQETQIYDYDEEFEEDVEVEGFYDTYLLETAISI